MSGDLSKASMTDYDNDQNQKLEQVFVSIDAMQVRMARDLLEGGGIETFIFDDESSRMLGSTVAIEARLMVHADCAEEARARLKELGFTQ
ncbi:MAG: DUF2007 domain-containing protein [Candidatus Binataceae bacterium]